MKPLCIPLLILTGLLALSLWAGQYTQQQTGKWTTLLEQADQLAHREQWQGAETQLRRTYADWSRCSALLHTLLEHGPLDQMEELFAAAFSACANRDAPAFHAAAVQLTTRLRLLAEAQQISAANIL